MCSIHINTAYKSGLPASQFPVRTKAVQGHLQKSHDQLPNIPNQEAPADDTNVQSFHSLTNNTISSLPTSTLQLEVNAQKIIVSELSHDNVRNSVCSDWLLGAFLEPMTGEGGNPSR